jgi:hypothetical protein
MTDESTSAITFECSLRCTAEHAFATYMAGSASGGTVLHGDAETLQAVTIEPLPHGGWTEASAAVREKFGDWPVLLDRFVELADSDD